MHEDFTSRFEEWQRDRIEEQVTDLPSLLALYKKWLYLEETEDIEVMLACLLDREIPGDPIWLQVIASSGDKKTEILRSFSDYDKAYTIDTLTPKTLISGLTRKNKVTGEPEPAAGLIFKINGKTLIIKDFTTILGKSEETRTEIYAQLRSIYDGYYEGGYGTLPDKIVAETRIGLIAAATPAIDRYNRLENALGTRFIKVRSDSDPIKAAEMALENASEVDRMRYQLRGAVSSFIKALRERGAFDLDSIPQLSEQQKRAVILMAQYVAMMRANVWGRFDRTGDLLALEAVNVEKPTRVAKQLMKLSQLLAIIRDHARVEQSEIATLQRVARDTAEPTRQKIIDAFRAHGDFNAPLTIQDIDGITTNLGKRVHYRTARNELEVMFTLGIIDRVEGGAYRINENFKRIARSVYLCSSVTSKNKPILASFSEVMTGESRGESSEDRRLIIRLVQREGSIGFLKLKELVEYRLGKTYRPGEFEAILREMDREGLICFDGKVVSIPEART